jgi:hypothetical protein
MSKIYTPLIKSRGFAPAPIAGNIPLWADSLNNPDCVGRKDYIEFWEEQLYYIVHGYHTGGIFIPPKYYELLNFGMVDGAGGKGFIRPYFLDLHHEIYSEEYEIRDDKSCAGMVIPKARRKALSFTAVQLIKYGMKYNQSYRAGVASGLATWTEGLQSKIYRTYNQCPPELKMSSLLKGEDDFVLGYEEKKANGWEKIISSTCLFETMKDSAKKFEGEYFDDVFLEEAGEFALAETALISISPALKDGDDFLGKIFVFGTGGEMSKSGKVFASIWHNAEAYHLKQMFIPGKRFYAPFVKKIYGESRTPFLDAQYPELSPEQLLGCEDILAAEEALKAESQRLASLPDKKFFIQHKQNMPENVEDVFVSGGSNKFDTNILYDQLYNISSLTTPKYVEYILDWEKEDDGTYKQPLAVQVRIAELKDPEWQRVKVYHLPDARYSNLDIGGCDTYNQDATQVGTSLGAIIVLRRADKLPNAPENGVIPCCTYYARPPRKEIHWEIALMISVWYGLIGNMMIAAEMDVCIGYFKNNFGKRFLAKRPKSFDAVDSKMTHEFGVKMTGSTKPKMISFMQSWVVDNARFCWDEKLCQDLVSYDENATSNNDWDLADALGLALVRISDSKRNVTNYEDNGISDSSNELISWGVNSHGVVVAGNEEEEMRKLFYRK